VLARCCDAENRAVAGSWGWGGRVRVPGCGHGCPGPGRGGRMGGSVSSPGWYRRRSGGSLGVAAPAAEGGPAPRNERTGLSGRAAGRTGCGGEGARGRRGYGGRDHDRAVWRGGFREDDAGAVGMRGPAGAAAVRGPSQVLVREGERVRTARERLPTALVFRDYQNRRKGVSRLAVTSCYAVGEPKCWTRTTRTTLSR
jgi:hypothetical protein